MDKIKEKLLEDFKRSNSKRKLTLAKRYGFSTPEEYLTSLEGKEITVVKPTIHNVVLLDATGSMNNGNKYNNSTKGINTEIEWLVKQTEANYTETVIEFIEQDGFVRDKVKFNAICKLVSNIDKIHSFAGAYGSNTPLYKAVLDIIDEISKSVSTSEKVLLKVYTDGENNRLGEYCRKCADRIKEVQKENFTVTFVSTKRDLSRIIKDLELEESNCLEIEDSGKGFEEAFDRSLHATMCYTKSVVEGEDVSKGFYKKLVK